MARRLCQHAGVLLALAQIASIALDVRANVEHHVRAVSAAAAAGARLVLFPELSLTGYELDAITQDRSLALDVDGSVGTVTGDDRLRPLQEVCRQRRITAIAGAPTRRAGERYLSSLTIGEGGEVGVYDKRNLFGQERELFAPGQAEYVLSIDGLRLALGICFDLSDEAQATAAATCDAWLLGVLLSPGGYRTDATAPQTWPAVTASASPSRITRHPRVGGSAPGAVGYGCPTSNRSPWAPALGCGLVDLNGSSTRRQVA